MGRGLRDTTVYKINKPQGCIVQHREYSQYFTITVNGILPLKMESLCHIPVTYIYICTSTKNKIKQAFLT